MMVIALSVALATAPAHGFVAPAFDDFSVAPSRLKVVKPPDLSSHADARTFRTVLRNGAKAGVNFAGHYTVVTWGCGSPCKRLALVDRWTGQVSFPPIWPALDAEFRVDSALLVVDSREAIRGVGPELRYLFYTQYWVWEEQLRAFRLLGEYPDEKERSSR